MKLHLVLLRAFSLSAATIADATLSTPTNTLAQVPVLVARAVTTAVPFAAVNATTEMPRIRLNRS